MGDPVQNEQHHTYFYNLVSESHTITSTFFYPFDVSAAHSQLEGIRQGQESLGTILKTGYHNELK